MEISLEVSRSKNQASSQYLCQKIEREYRVVIANMASEETEWDET